MRFVKPEVKLIAKTIVIDSQVQEWLLTVGCDNETAKKYATRYEVTENAVKEVKTDAERLIELAGRRCYKSFQPGLNTNVTRIRTDIADYIHHIMESGHGSVLEHYYATFAIENISRVLTGELNRHRAGAAISEASMRFIRYDDIPMVETPLMILTEEEFAALEKKSNDHDESTFTAEDHKNLDIALKKEQTRALFTDMFEKDEEGYKEFCEIWKEELAPESTFTWKKNLTSLGRRFIGMGVATGGVWTFNIRALRHICTMRCSEAAEEEICVVANKILEIMMEKEPVLFGDFGKDEKGFYAPKYKKV